jgi:hypothetical protein
VSRCPNRASRTNCAARKNRGALTPLVAAHLTHGAALGRFGHRLGRRNGLRGRHRLGRDGRLGSRQRSSLRRSPSAHSSPSSRRTSESIVPAAPTINKSRWTVALTGRIGVCDFLLRAWPPLGPCPDQQRLGRGSDASVNGLVDVRLSSLGGVFRGESSSRRSDVFVVCLEVATSDP